MKKPKYITDGYKLYRFGRWVFHDGRYYGSEDEGVPIGSEAWVDWVQSNNQLVYCTANDEHRSILKRESGKRAPYWRGYQWPVSKETPLRVYVGKLEDVDAEELRQKMRQLTMLADDARRASQAKREKISRERRRKYKREWARKWRAEKRSRNSTG